MEQDIQKQIQGLKEAFDSALIIEPTMDELQKWLKKIMFRRLRRVSNAILI